MGYPPEKLVPTTPIVDLSNKGISEMFAAFFRTFTALLCLICLPGLVFFGGTPAAGEDFRMDNKVFFGGEKEAASQSTTIFHDGVVYDYLQKPAEVIVFETVPGRFILLDTERRIRAELTTDAVTSFTQRLQESAAEQQDPFIRFRADPEFEEEFDAASGQLTLSSPWMTYRLVLEGTVGKEIAAQYRAFSDWYARVNTLLQPGAMPAEARLLINGAIFKYQSFAKEVHLTIVPKKTFPPKKVDLHSEHHLTRQVAEADLDRVAQTRQFMEIFKPVSFEQYRGSLDR